MKLLQKATLTLLIALSMAVYSCGPNDNNGATDEGNSNKEGAIDSTRLTNMDSTSVSQGDTIK